MNKIWIEKPIWVFEKGFELPFGIHGDDLSEKNIEVN